MREVRYIRWSSEKQTDSSSLRRQQRMTREMSEKMGWTFERELRDEAVSAYFGHNLDDGKLGDFIRQCEAEGGDGIVLSCEMISRISRLNAYDAVMNIGRMIETGLTVAIADQTMIIDQRSIRNQRQQLEAIVEAAEKAHREIADGARLIRAAWQDMRDEGRPVHCSSTCPAWLEMDGERTRFLGLDQSSATAMRRVAVLNEIFDLYIRGKGFRLIARLLNERGEPTWRGGIGWQASTIKALIHNRATVGEYRHHVQRRPVGEPVANYFPAAISNEKFALANASAHRRIMASHSSVRKLVNMLSESARCSECGSRMLFLNKSRKANGEPVAYLQCDGYARGLGCDAGKMVPYYPVERRLLDELLPRALDDQHFQRGDEVAGLRRRMADQQRDIDAINLRIANISDSIEHFTGGNEVLRRGFEVRLMTAAAELDKATKVRAELSEQLEVARGKATRAEHIKRVADIRADLRSENEERRNDAGRLVKMALNDIIETAICDQGKRRVLVRLVAGLGTMWISWGGTGGLLDLQRDGRDHAEGKIGAEREAIKGYMRRNRA